MFKAETQQNKIMSLTVVQWINIFLPDKNGVPPSEAADLVKLVLTQCPHLNFSGLMTIGAFNHSISDGENPDFIVSMTNFNNNTSVT